LNQTDSGGNVLGLNFNTKIFDLLQMVFLHKNARHYGTIIPSTLLIPQPCEKCKNSEWLQEKLQKKNRELVAPS
jgi:hypothetical protein